MTIDEVVQAAAEAGLDVNIQQNGDVVRVFVTDKASGSVTEFTGTKSGEPIPEPTPEPVAEPVVEPAAALTVEEAPATEPDVAPEAHEV